MRVAIVGTSGSGKSTFGARLQKVCALPAIELDEINWRPGWFDRSKQDQAGFVADVQEQISGDFWSIAGNYGTVRPLIWQRATHVVWLDLPRPLVMIQVLQRSIPRAFSGKDVFPGCREDVFRMFRKDHPIRYAWDTHARRRAEYQSWLERPEFQHIKVFRCTNRAEVEAAFSQLQREIVARNSR